MEKHCSTCVTQDFCTDRMLCKRLANHPAGSFLCPACKRRDCIACPDCMGDQPAPQGARTPSQAVINDVTHGSAQVTYGFVSQSGHTAEARTLANVAKLWTAYLLGREIDQQGLTAADARQMLVLLEVGRNMQ